jgi:hypothetical protein
MEAFPDDSYALGDKHTLAEYSARHVALGALIDEAGEAGDEYRLGIYTEAHEALQVANPGHAMNPQPHASEEQPELLSAAPDKMRVIDHIGLVLGLPSSRRKLWAISDHETRVMLGYVDAAAKRSEANRSDFRN